MNNNKNWFSVLDLFFFSSNHNKVGGGVGGKPLSKSVSVHRLKRVTLYQTENWIIIQLFYGFLWGDGGLKQLGLIYMKVTFKCKSNWSLLQNWCFVPFFHF